MIAVALSCPACAHQRRASGTLAEVVQRLQQKEGWQLTPLPLCPQDETASEVALVVTCDSCSEKKGLRGGSLKGLLHRLQEKGWVLRPTISCPACHKVTPGDGMVTEVYTDGSAVGSNPGFGGWGWATATAGASGASPHQPTTNQRMEIMAAVEGIRSNPGQLRVYSDSSYVVNCMSKGWYKGWRKNGWRTGKREPVKNQDLWQELVEAVEGHGAPIEFIWVKGHADTPLNNKADELARGAARKAQEKAS